MPPMVGTADAPAAAFPAVEAAPLSRKRAVAVWSLVGLAAAWLAGPARWATAIRRRLAPHFRGEPGLVFGVVGFAYLLVILWGPTGATGSFSGSSSSGP
jgi:hypothetical protein